MCARNSIVQIHKAQLEELVPLWYALALSFHQDAAALKASPGSSKQALRQGPILMQRQPVRMCCFSVDTSIVSRTGPDATYSKALVCEDVHPVAWHRFT